VLLIRREFTLKLDKLQPPTETLQPSPP